MSFITISTKSIFRVEFPQCVAVFTPTDTPFADGEDLYLSGPREFHLDGNGRGTVELETGNYTLVFKGIPGNADSFTLGVPNDSDTYRLIDRLSNGVNVLPSSASAYSGNAAALGITDLVGGGATNLDGFATVGIGSLLFWVDSATYGFGLWEKVAGTHVTDVANGWLRPLDYNISTNAFVWKRRQ